MTNSIRNIYPEQIKIKAMEADSQNNRMDLKSYMMRGLARAITLLFVVGVSMLVLSILVRNCNI
jgi:hypothetical protein